MMRVDGSTVVSGCGDSLAVLEFATCPIPLSHHPVVRRARRLAVGGIDKIKRPSAAAERAVALVRRIDREAAAVRRVLEHPEGRPGG